jgi:GNAT superfamily N-acetyltransferase
LFDAYRLFYEQHADLDLARDFMTERLSNLDSVVLLARCDKQAVGFTQLYPSFSSTRARRIFILNDLFVAAEARGAGIAASFARRSSRICARGGCAPADAFDGTKQHARATPL